MSYFKWIRFMSRLTFDPNQQSIGILFRYISLQKNSIRNTLILSIVFLWLSIQVQPSFFPRLPKDDFSNIQTRIRIQSRNQFLQETKNWKIHQNLTHSTSNTPIPVRKLKGLFVMSGTQNELFVRRRCVSPFNYKINQNRYQIIRMSFVTTYRILKIPTIQLA